MKTTITTTITTDIDLESMKPSHKVEIEPEDDLPQDLIYAAVAGALKATMNSIPERFRNMAKDDDEPAPTRSSQDAADDGGRCVWESGIHDQTNDHWCATHKVWSDDHPPTSDDGGRSV